MSGGTLYGATVWSPTLIIAQIIAVQCAFYVCLGLLAWLLVGKFVSFLDSECPCDRSKLVEARNSLDEVACSLMICGCRW